MKIIINYYTLILLTLAFFSSCQKGIQELNDPEFRFLTFKSLEQKISLNQVDLDGVSLPKDFSNYLYPNLGQDSLDLTLHFNRFPSKKIRIENTNKQITHNIFFENLVDSAIKVGPHPLESEKVREGYVGLKFFGLNKTYSPDGRPIHIVVQELEGKPVIGKEAKYITVDTMFNISKNIPDKFSFFKKRADQAYYRLKVLNSDKKDFIYNNKHLYFFYPLSDGYLSIEKLIEIPPRLYFRNEDPNSEQPITDGGARLLLLVSNYMSK